MTFALALGLALAMMPLAMRLAVAVGLVDRPSDPELEIHARPVPILGGPAVIAAALVATAVRGHDETSMVVWGVAFALCVGLIDDAHPLPAWLRLGLLACAGALLAVGGVRISPLGVLAWVAVPVLSVVCANGVNILDGQNGLAGGVGAAGALGLAAVAGSSASGIRSLGLAVAGGLVGFLVWNLRGRIFLGNGGAYALGTMLAALAGLSASAQGWRGVLAAGACLGLIPFEILSTLTRRARAGAPLFPGDRNHTYDIVARKIGSRARSTILFWLLASAAAGVGIGIVSLPLGAGASLLVLIVAAAVWWARSLMPDGEMPDRSAATSGGTPS